MYQVDIKKYFYLCFYYAKIIKIPFLSKCIFKHLIWRGEVSKYLFALPNLMLI